MLTNGKFYNFDSFYSLHNLNQIHRFLFWIRVHLHESLNLNTKIVLLIVINFVSLLSSLYSWGGGAKVFSIRGDFQSQKPWNYPDRFGFLIEIHELWNFSKCFSYTLWKNQILISIKAINFQLISSGISSICTRSWMCGIVISELIICTLDVLWFLIL